jgi:hypothetical protein
MRAGQVLSLFPGMRLSRAKFRGPSLLANKRDKKRGSLMLCKRFPNDKDLLLLLDGAPERASSAAGAGGGGLLKANDLARRGHGMEMEGVRETRAAEEGCLEVAYDKDISHHVPGEFYATDVVAGELPQHLCNYRATSSDLMHGFKPGAGGCVGGYAVAIDVDLDLDSEVDQYLLTGGTARPDEEALNKWRGQLQPKYVVDERGLMTSDTLPCIFQVSLTRSHVLACPCRFA